MKGRRSMSRREQIRKAISGGNALRRPKGSKFGAATLDQRNVGGAKGPSRLAAPGQGFTANPGLAAPQRSQKRSQRQSDIKAGISKSRAQAGLGSQLTGRVESGKITEEQAARTARERAVLEKRFGPDWRTKVYGDQGYAKRTRKALAANPDSKRLQALNAQLMERRRRLLEQGGKSTGG